MMMYFYHEAHKDLHEGHKERNRALCETFVSLVVKDGRIVC